MAAYLPTAYTYLTTHTKPVTHCDLATPPTTICKPTTHIAGTALITIISLSINPAQSLLPSTRSLLPPLPTPVRFHLVLVVLVVLVLFGLAYSCSPLIPPPPPPSSSTPAPPPLTLLSCSPSPRAPISTTGSNLGSWDDSHDNHISQLKLRDEHPGAADPHLRIHQQDPRHPHHRQVPSSLSCTHPVGPSTAEPQRRSPHLHSGTLAQSIVSPTPHT